MRYVFGHYLDCGRWWRRDSNDRLGSIILFHKGVTDLTKTGQCSPTSFHGTGTRYSVTFTFRLKKSFNDLKYCKKKRNNTLLSVIFVGKFLLRLLSSERKFSMTLICFRNNSFYNTRRYRNKFIVLSSKFS